MAFLGRHRRIHAVVTGSDGAAPTTAAARAQLGRDELAALLRRAERAGLDPDRVLAALGLDLALASDGAGHHGRPSPRAQPGTGGLDGSDGSHEPARARRARSKPA